MSTTPFHILAINPGSTSTKIAVYAGEQELFRKSIDHPADALLRLPRTMEQLPLRRKAIEQALAEQGFDPRTLHAIAGRGGPLPPVKAGAYRVNDCMVDYLSHKAPSEHASKLGAVLAFQLGESLGIPSFIYDSIRVDEVEDIARYSGLPVLPRKPGAHVLNMRAVALKTRDRLGHAPDKATYVVAHLGGGITLAVLRNGRILDYVGDDEGPFSPERAGRLPYRRFIDLCYSGAYGHKEMMRLVRGQGGLMGYLGTSDAREVEKRIAAGDAQARQAYEGMAYQVAKAIGELATVVAGQVDAVILTGGIAYSSMFTQWVSQRVRFIAPVEIVPGENELEALALGVLRVLEGREEAHTFTVA